MRMEHDAVSSQLNANRGRKSEGRRYVSVVQALSTSHLQFCTLNLHPTLPHLFDSTFAPLPPPRIFNTWYMNGTGNGYDSSLACVIEAKRRTGRFRTSRQCMMRVTWSRRKFCRYDSLGYLYRLSEQRCSPVIIVILLACWSSAVEVEAICSCLEYGFMGS